MLIAYALSDQGPRAIAPREDGGVPAEANWVDLNQPSRPEELAAEAFLKASLPTREEAQEIEFSSRFYAEDGAVFMTASLLTGIDIDKPALVPLTLAVAGDRIVTLRYEELRAQKQFLARASKPGSGCVSTPGVFFGLIEAIVDRTADVLEKIIAKIPIGRLGKAEDIARGVVFLTADEAEFVTGSTLSINGGQHMY